MDTKGTEQQERSALRSTSSDCPVLGSPRRSQMLSIVSATCARRSAARAAGKIGQTFLDAFGMDASLGPLARLKPIVQRKRSGSENMEAPVERPAELVALLAISVLDVLLHRSW